MLTQQGGGNNLLSISVLYVLFVIVILSFRFILLQRYKEFQTLQNKPLKKFCVVKKSIGQLVNFHLGLGDY